jgi:cytochrome c-type biogenesis protein CcmH
MKAFLAVLTLVFASTAQPQTSTEDDTLKYVNHIARQLIAPCCWNQTADAHQSDAAKAIKAQIRDGLRAGWSEKRIIEQIVAQYGEKIRAVPKAEGFNLALWISIGLVGLIGSVLLFFYLRRVSLAGPTSRTDSLTDKSLTSRIEKELERLDDIN